MSMIGFPLLLIPLAVVNIVIFLMNLPLARLQDKVFTVDLPSLEPWTITFSDVLLAFALFLLLIEVVKSARPGAKYFTDHLLSFVVFAAAAAEFLLLPQFAHSTFFLLTLMALTDVVAGIWIRAVRPKAVAVRAAPPPVEPERPVARTEVAEPTPAPPPPPKPAADVEEPRMAEPLPAEPQPVEPVAAEQRDAPIAPQQEILPPEPTTPQR